MKSIIVAYPVRDTAWQIKNVLESNGFYVSHICATGASVLGITAEMREGIVVTASILKDMSAATLYENLSSDFDVIALTRGADEIFSDGVISLTLPLDKWELLDSVAVLMSSHSSFTKRDNTDSEIIANAKNVLMNVKGISELQAHKYLQRESMRTGKKLVSIAQEIINQFKHGE